jgi:hypothetical protein
MADHPHGRIRYFAGDWSPENLAEIRAELARRGIAATLEGDELFVDRHHEREVDMLVESVTEE